MTIAQKAVRYELGEFMSTVCFKAAVTGLEEVLGEKAAAIALSAAGRKRGKQLAEQFNLVNQGLNISFVDLASKLRHAIGVEGTRLCIVDRIEQDNEVLKVYARETVCSAGEEEGSSRRCTYTLGALQGFLEAVTGHRLRGKQTESVLKGSDYDVLEFHFLR